MTKEERLDKIKQTVHENKVERDLARIVVASEASEAKELAENLLSTMEGFSMALESKIQEKEGENEYED